MPQERQEKTIFRKWIKLGWIIIFFIFGIGGAWSWFARISGAVIAPAQISPESGVRTIQHPDGGVAKEIRIADGDAVRKGQVLMVLEDENLKADLAVTQNRLDNVLAEMARLKAEQERAEKISFPLLLKRRAEKDNKIRELIRMQRTLFASRRRALRGQQQVLKQNITAQEKAIEGLKARLRSIERQSALIAEEIATVSDLLSKGHAIRPRLLALQREAARLEGEHGQLIEEIARRKEEISRLSNELNQVERVFLARVMEELVRRREEAASLREKLSALKLKLSRVLIRAPVSGHVFNMTVRTIGGVITPGTPIMQIMPDNEPLIIEARVRPIDIDEVYIGQPARVYFSVFGGNDTPKLKGKVEKISPAPLSEEKGQPPFYLVKIRVPHTELARLGRNRKLVPGMPVEVFITTQERRPFDILVSDVLMPKIRRALRSD